jgi:type II secretory pathway pseudopilin PulG
MNRHFPSRGAKGFTLVELLVIIAILALLFAMLVPAVAAGKRKAQRIRCTNNLMQVGISFRLWRTDHGDKHPSSVSTNKVGGLEYVVTTNFAARHFFLSMSNALAAPGVLVCAADTRRQATNMASLKDANLSYFAGLDSDESKPRSLLAGDRNLAVNGVQAEGGIVEVHPTDELGWTKAMHRYEGNLALGDGSVQNLRSRRLFRLSGLPGVTDRLAFP